MQLASLRPVLRAPCAHPFWSGCAALVRVRPKWTRANGGAKVQARWRESAQQIRERSRAC